VPEITYAQAIKDAMSEEMRRDERVFLLGEDVGRYGGAFGQVVPTHETIAAAARALMK